MNSLLQRTDTRPAPELPGALALIDGEEDDLRLADDILERHHSDLAETAVGRVVAIVAHHEVVVGRHGVDLRVVGKTVIDQIERIIAHAVRQCFLPALDRRVARAFFRFDEVGARSRLTGAPLMLTHAVDDLDLVARQTDHALDVIGRRVLRQPKHDHIAALSATSRREAAAKVGGDSGSEYLL